MNHKESEMNPTLRTISLALLAGTLAGAGTAAYVLGANPQSKIGLEYDAGNGRQHLELGQLATGDATGRPPRFWGLEVENGDSLTSIGVYSARTATGASYVPPRHAAKLPE
jgi:hypothetical protein